MSIVSDRDVAFYRENGYLVVEDVIDKATLAEIKRVIAELVEGARGKTAHDDVYDLEPSHTPDDPRVRRIKKPNLVHPVFDRLIRSERMIGVLRQLIGENVRLHGSKLNMKAPHYGSPVEWHQDWAFYPHTNDDILAVGCMLDDMLLENGPLLALPGSHRAPKVWDHHAEGRFCGAIDPVASGLDLDQAVAITGPAGSCSFHHVRLLHGSAQNRSQRSRNLLLYECAAADAWPLMNFTNLDEFDSRMLCGSPTVEPRLEKVPVRMPYPPARSQGSIYENQTGARARYFEVAAV